jgi:putative intracellular protease/amidase
MAIAANRIRNAGGAGFDREVVQDGQLTTSRKPDDIPAFNFKKLGVLRVGCRSPSDGLLARLPEASAAG